MIEIRQTEDFADWLHRLRDDNNAYARIVTRLERLAEGNPGDVRAAGTSVARPRTSREHGS
jgi:putative addiction module killer protein